MKKPLLILSILFILLASILIYQNITYNDKKLHIVVCDVGQGDAIFIRTPAGSDILVDGGPDDSVLTCLGKHMPFWDRDLELVILTHPHSDHFIGLFSILKSYKVKSFATEELENKTLGFGELMKTIKNQAIVTRFVFAGDKFRLKDGVMLEIVGPTEEFLSQTSPGGAIGKSGEFASVLTLIRYEKFTALLTGDSQAPELREALQPLDSAPLGAAQGKQGKLSVLQVPHHASKTGLTSDILDALNPSLAVISVGEKNKYGHPAPFILDLLKSKNIKTLRTDQDGEVELVSDGKDLALEK